MMRSLFSTPAGLRQVARWLLLGWLLVLGVASASPLVSPRSMEMVCMGNGAMQWVVWGDGEPETVSHAGHAADCPLCANGLGAPPAHWASWAALPLTAIAPVLLTDWPPAWLSVPALPARGPPVWL